MNVVTEANRCFETPAYNVKIICRQSRPQVYDNMMVIG